MSFDAEALDRQIRLHGRVARVVVTSCAGSTPRDVGASMLVWPGGQMGTIGGGALEHEAAARARDALANGDRLDKVALGPGIGQCCGGGVVLLTEVWDAARLAALGERAATGDAVVRPMPGAPPEMPLKVANRLRAARNGATPLRPEALQGWMIEPLRKPARHLWIWGAGHVGRALIGVLHPLPELHLTWIDTSADRFPDLPEGVTRHIAAQPGLLVATAPARAEHLIVTYSHALDLELCHLLLGHGFARCGLIGSATKWARFRARLQALGHGLPVIDTIECPIGDPALGKHPQAIALGVGASLLRAPRTHAHRQETTG